MRLLTPLLLALAPAWGQWGGELRLNLRSEPRSFHPALADDDASEMIRYLTAGVLVRVNRITQQPEPSLAASWKVLEGGRAIRFQLRENLRFSDGTPFTADDVAFTMDTILNPDLHSPVGDSFRTGGVRTIPEGPHCVLIRFSEPLAGGPALFDRVAIMSRKSPLKEAAVLGPFHVAGHKPGAGIRLERNPHYWKTKSGRRLPYLDSIQFSIQQNRDAEFLRFSRGELHMIPALEPEQFEELSRSKPGLARDAGPTLANEFLWFNMTPAGPCPHTRRRGSRRGASAARCRTPSAAKISAGSCIAATPHPAWDHFRP